MSVNLLSTIHSDLKPSNARMVPTIKIAIDADDRETLKELKRLYPETYEASFKYLPKSCKQFLESTRLT